MHATYSFLYKSVIASCQNITNGFGIKCLVSIFVLAFRFIFQGLNFINGVALLGFFIINYILRMLILKKDKEYFDANGKSLDGVVELIVYGCFIAMGSLLQNVLDVEGFPLSQGIVIFLCTTQFAKGYAKIRYLGLKNERVEKIIETFDK
jgi:hypothetical protein